MRATLLTAQRMADSIVKEAEVKRDEMLSQAESAARDKIQQYREEVRVCEERLKQGQLELARFVAESRSVCEKQMAFLAQLPELPVEAAPVVEAPAEEMNVADIEEKVLAAFAVEDTVAEEAPAPAEEKEDPFVTEETTMEDTRRISLNLSELKFGRNYGKD